MEFNEVFSTAYGIAKLAIAVWMISRTLPRREPRLPIILGTLAVIIALGAGSIMLGFSAFPALTSNESLFFAVAAFVVELLVATTLQRVVYDCPLWTSVFCCSMAYSIENLSSAAQRIICTSFLPTNYPPQIVEESIRYWSITAVVFVAVYLLLVRRIERGGLLQIDDPVMVIAAAIVIGVNMVLDLAVKDSTFPYRGLPSFDVIALSWVYLFLCVYILYSVFEIVYNRRLQENVLAIERLRASEARQYQMSRENIEAINIKCHDLKHQIRALASGGAAVDGRVLADISREVGVYDSVVKSGNIALDTILTEKSLYCEKHGITLSCIADGEALGFVEPTELYSFFGNALDNAIEAVERLGDPERRSIALVVKRIGGMVSVHVENYFNGRVEFSGEGLPRTCKDDPTSHGFGVRSMRMIVEGHGGSLTCRAVDDVFHLDALVPVPE